MYIPIIKNEMITHRMIVDVDDEDDVVLSAEGPDPRVR